MAKRSRTNRTEKATYQNIGGMKKWQIEATKH